MMPRVFHHFLRVISMKTRFLFALALLISLGCSNTDTDTADLKRNDLQTIAPVQMGIPEGPGANHVPNANLPDVIDLTEPGKFVRSTTEPEIIDTRDFQPQIQNAEPFQGQQKSTSIFRPKKGKKPLVPVGPENDLVAGGLNNLDRTFTGSFFPGISASPWNPPDPSLGVGPNHIIQTVNMELAFFLKDGTQTFQQRLDSSGSPGFFESIGAGDFTFDPKCFYDHYSNRFFVLALEVYENSNEAYITFAVSDDNDPNGIWFKYRTPAVVQIGSTTYWVDYPGLGFDLEGFYVSGNLFRLSGGGDSFGGVLFRAFEKSPLLGGQTAVFNDLLDTNAASVQAAQMFGNNIAPMFVSRNSSTELRVTAIENAFTSPSLDTKFVSIPSAPGAPGGAPNGSGGSIGTVGGRIMNAHWRDGRLWACHAIDIGNRAVARWYEMNTGNWPNSGSPSLVQSGNIDLGSGNYTFFPAIYTDANNSAAIVFAKSRSNEFASVQAAGRLAADPTGSMSSPVTLDIGNSTADGRWGDYFDIALDPTDDRTFWMVGEIHNDGGWQTVINSFKVAVPFVPSDSLLVFRGIQVAGDLEDTFESDDQRIEVNPGLVLNLKEAPVQLIFDGNVGGSGAFDLLIESQANTAGLTYTAEMWNWNTNSYEVVGTQNESSGSDSVETFAVDPSDHINGSGDVRARIGWRATGPLLLYPWTIKLDQLGWVQ
jgi:hypothetical protein